jgi:hypothetical protein
MKFSEWRPPKRFFLIVLGAACGLLLIYGILRAKFGAFMPKWIDQGLPDFVVITAVGVALWNREIRDKDAKAAKAAKEEAERRLRESEEQADIEAEEREEREAQDRKDGPEGSDASERS